MDRHRRKETDRRLAALSRSERERLYKRALKLRGAATRKDREAAGDRRRTNAKSWDQWMEEGAAVYEPLRRRGGRSVSDWMKKLLDEEGQGRPAARDRPSSSGDSAHDRDGEVSARVERGASTEASAPDVVRGTVLQIAPGACTVAAGGSVIRCVLPAEIAVLQQSKLAVGDIVTFRPRGGGGLISGVLARKSALSRPDPHVPERERVIVANMDVVVIVVSVKSPPLRVRLIDRCLIAVQRGGAMPVVCVNKVDLLSAGEERSAEMARLDPYRPADFPIAFTSAETGEGLDVLRDSVSGRRCVFIGHSGVGKSSLLNALDPGLRLATRPVSDATGRGTHTTSAASLFRLAGGTEIIDTPGVRAIGLWRIERRDLPWYFPEFETFAEACRFRDCSHTVEPDCAVKDAAQSGRIAPARYDTYRRILGTLEDAMA